MEMVEYCTEGSCIFFVQPFHHQGSLQTPTVRRLQAFSMPKSPEWTRSVDTGFPWQNPPNAPIFVNIPTAAVWYIIKKASAKFGKRTVLYRVPRMKIRNIHYYRILCSYQTLIPYLEMNILRVRPVQFCRNACSISVVRVLIASGIFSIVIHLL